MQNKNGDIEHQVKQWLEQVVIGLHLCPFAKAPYNKEKIKFVVSHAATEEALIETLISECHFLDNHKATETTLIICNDLLSDFFDYSHFLQWAEQTLKRHQWQGIYQIASFHPDYQFLGCDAEAPQNLTNRSPFPILHLLREQTLSQVLAHYENPDDIPRKNIETMERLTEKEKRHYFSFLFNANNDKT